MLIEGRGELVDGGRSLVDGAPELVDIDQGLVDGGAAGRSSIGHSCERCGAPLPLRASRWCDRCRPARANRLHKRRRVPCPTCGQLMSHTAERCWACFADERRARRPLRYVSPRFR
ncbi:hypothetical protein Acsp06_41480 [Actinomycetospora sp. NBRC 106375]|uniref:hypothetical protein n=1 Tax=Actinomycetospora sp. NBRC 106375 TaxID=3032207 RepID=UPI0024A147C2|nr:hypothetical protein [Actinomycetospora sp. NBRC 106375]GLZ47963.1 hypothetical protein Acsp06_41480 [Actinomycetospora sp. NBRC 106375]